MDVLKKIAHIILLFVIILNVNAFASEQNRLEISNDGLWTSKCSKADSFYFQTEINIIDDLWTETKAYYSDSHCMRTRHFEISKMYQYNLNKKDIDYKALMSWVRPLTNKSIAYLKSLQQCQNKSWIRGKRIEITGEACLNDIFPKEQSNLYNIMSFEGERNTFLWIGELTPELDGSSNEKRPTEFRPDPLIKNN